MTLSDVWAADVNRWHHNKSRRLRDCGDTVDKHSNRMIRLMVYLNPAGVDQGKLALAIAVHDIGETATGDVSYVTKREHPDLSAKLDQLEWQARKNMHQRAPTLNPLEERWLRFLDRLDSYLMANDADPSVLSLPEWTRDYTRLQDQAKSLGIDLAAELGYF
jgi:hypothetical protein